MKRLLSLPLDFDEDQPLPTDQLTLIEKGKDLLQQFWDRWHEKPIEQYVACDFDYVARAMRGIRAEGLADGNTFCEWGCGFGIVTGLASLNGWDAVGIEAESFLVERARQLIQDCKIDAEIWEGNFLPRGSERLADRQSNHASLFHRIAPVYEQHDMEVDDFAIIFAYPWPGEEFFLQTVFEEYARKDALLLMFRGPYQIEFYRKTK